MQQFFEFAPACAKCVQWNSLLYLFTHCEAYVEMSEQRKLREKCTKYLKPLN